MAQATTSPTIESVELKIPAVLTDPHVSELK